ncbi:hypothetical protein GQ44DRAFT_700057 [Phaeosphaeriaceae sp. PMI808]|nr:hypothetical protein GQ44DRAFT_700057 [Phaeosphaeriaceae sp. PMI808]
MLLRNPERARWIRVLRLGGGGLQALDLHLRFGDAAHTVFHPVELARSIWREKHEYNKAFSNSDTEDVWEIVKGLDWPSGNVWMAELKRGNVDTFVALILSQLQSLECLDLGFAYLKQSVFITSMLRQSMVRGNWFPLLEEVKLAPDLQHPYCAWLNLDLTRSLFFLPEVKSITTAFPEPVIFAWPSPNSLPHPTSLSKLVLRKSTASPQTLEHLLTCTSTLKHLTYEYYCISGGICPNREVARGECPRILQMETHGQHNHTCNACEDIPQSHERFIYARHIGSAVSKVGHTLESLVLKIHFEGFAPQSCMDNDVVYEPPGTPRCSLIGRVEHLNEMVNLKELEISWVLLFGWEADAPAEKHLPRAGVRFKMRKNGILDLSEYQWADVLPHGLEKLCLRNDMSKFTSYGYTRYAVAAMFKNLLEVRKTDMCSLNYVSLFFIYRHAFEEQDSESKLHVNTLRAMCEHEGVTCQIFRGCRAWWRPED